MNSTESGWVGYQNNELTTVIQQQPHVSTFVRRRFALLTAVAHLRGLNETPKNETLKFAYFDERGFEIGL